MYEDADESGMYDDAEDDVEVLTTAVVVDAGADGTHHSPIQHIETHASWLTVRATNPVGRGWRNVPLNSVLLPSQVTPDVQTVCVCNVDDAVTQGAEPTAAAVTGDAAEKVRSVHCTLCCFAFNIRFFFPTRTHSFRTQYTGTSRSSPAPRLIVC